MLNFLLKNYLSSVKEHFTFRKLGSQDDDSMLLRKELILHDLMKKFCPELVVLILLFHSIDFWIDIVLFSRCLLFKFSHIVYSPDMPSRLPLRELFGGLAKNIVRALRFWIHYTLVVVAWLGVVPLTACKFFICSWRGNDFQLAMATLHFLLSKRFHGGLSVSKSFLTK